LETHGGEGVGHKTRIRDIEELRERIVNALEDSDKLVIDAAVAY
jgi:hypothetical protein